MNKKQFMILIICVLLIALAVVSFVYIRQTNLLREKERRIRYLEDQLRETEREKNELEEAKRKDEKDFEESKKYSDLYVAMADKLGLSFNDERKKGRCWYKLKIKSKFINFNLKYFKKKSLRSSFLCVYIFCLV